MASCWAAPLLTALITAGRRGAALGFGWRVTAILLVTVLFANFAEAIAEARGRGQAAVAARARARTWSARRLVGRWRASERVRRGRDLRPGDLRAWSSAGELIPADGEIVAGPRHHQRIRGHRRIRAGAARGRHRPQRRDRRHQGAVRRDRGARHRRSGPQLPRPHDRAWSKARNRQKTPNETRADRAAGGDDADLPDRLRDAAGDRRVRRRRGRSAAAGRAAGVPDPDHHRRPAAGDRHRRHEPRAVAPTCWPSPARRWRWPATSTCCCSTRPARSPTATARPPPSIRSPASAPTSCATPRCWPRWPTRRRKASRSSRWRASRARRCGRPP